MGERGYVTKTIRLTPEESRMIEKAVSQVSYASEASLLKKFVLDGLRQFQLEQAIKSYVDGELTLSQAAEKSGLGYNAFYEELERRRVLIMDLDEEFMARNLKEWADRLGLPALKEAVEETCPHRSPP